MKKILLYLCITSIPGFLYNAVPGVGLVGGIPPQSPRPPAPKLPVSAPKFPTAQEALPVAEPIRPMTQPAMLPTTNATTTHLDPIIIDNLSTLQATLNDATAIIENSSQIIQISKPLQKGKQTIHLSIPSAKDKTVDFGGYTSISINNTPISIIHPKTKANYFGNSTIYIDNKNGIWQTALKPVEKPIKTIDEKTTTPQKKNSTKSTLIKPVARAYTQAKKQLTTSKATKVINATTTNSSPAPKPMVSTMQPSKETTSIK